VVRSKVLTGFTVVELLVSTAILGILAALMFPVLTSAREAAKRTQCLNNYRSIGHALMLYEGDYDDKVPPVNYRKADPTRADEDRTWVQTLLPYAGDFNLFRCPSDTGRQGSPPPGISGPPGDSWARYYGASLRSNLGYNYLYFSPLVEMSPGRWQAYPIAGASIGSPSTTIVFIDSVWDRTMAGAPIGGGSWVVVPPCRYRQQAGAVTDTFNIPPDASSYFGFDPGGWQPTSTLSWLVYGGAWPWHRGRFNVLYADGRTASLRIGDLTTGCDFKERWQGYIRDASAYLWDVTE